MAEWRAVRGFEGKYEVSDDGRVRRCARVITRSNGHVYHVAEKELAQVRWGHKRLYLGVGLKVAPRTNRTFGVHRLVAEAFIPNPDELPHVNHQNLNKHDNRKANLEWATESENQQHAALRGRFHGRTNPNARFKLQPKQVDEIIWRLAQGARQVDLARDYGVSPSMIGHIKRGTAWQQPGV